MSVGLVCPCRRCFEEWLAGQAVEMRRDNMGRRFLCPLCAGSRCAKAADHRAGCEMVVRS